MTSDIAAIYSIDKHFRNIMDLTNHILGENETTPDVQTVLLQSMNNLHISYPSLSRFSKFNKGLFKKMLESRSKTKTRFYNNY